jgi:hypothetical protein
VTRKKQLATVGLSFCQATERSNKKEENLRQRTRKISGEIPFRPLLYFLSGG